MIDPARAHLMIIDVQDRLIPALSQSDRMIAHCAALTGAARKLDVPILISEQYPSGLGSTVSALNVPSLVEANAARVMSKTDFSVLADGAMRDHLATAREAGRDQLVLAGCEAHVCVLQTALDAVVLGYEVFCVWSAISSRRMPDRSIAMRRLGNQGVVPITTEMAMFECLGTAKNPAFKSISEMVKTLPLPVSDAAG